MQLSSALAAVQKPCKTGYWKLQDFSLFGKLSPPAVAQIKWLLSFLMTAYPYCMQAGNISPTA